MKSLICKILGHNWVYLPKPDWLSKRRECERCKLEQKRTKFDCSSIMNVIEIWEDK